MGIFRRMRIFKNSPFLTFPFLKGIFGTSHLIKKPPATPKKLFRTDVLRGERDFEERRSRSSSIANLRFLEKEIEIERDFTGAYGLCPTDFSDLKGG